MKSLKRILTIMMAVTVVAIGATAQSRQGKWTVTPRVGVNSSDVTGLKWYETTDDGKNVERGNMKTKRKWGLTAGADVECLVNRRIGLSAGVFYSNQGYAYDGNGESGEIYYGDQKMDGTMYVHLHMFNMPLMVNVYLLPGLALKTGLQVDGLISARQKYHGESEDILNSLKTVGLSIPVGLSLDVSRLSLDVRYSFGLTDYCDVRAMNNLGANWKTNVLCLTLGYRIAIK